MSKIVLDPEFEAAGVWFESDSRKAHETRIWSRTGRQWIHVPAVNRVVAYIVPDLQLPVSAALLIADSGPGYRWTYTLQKKWGSNDSIEQINRAKGEILSKVAKTRQLEYDWINGPAGKAYAKQVEEYRRVEEERDAEKKLKSERQQKALNLVAEAGISPDEHGSWESGRSDEHEIVVLDIISDPLALRQYFATGEALAVVAHERTRSYARSSRWRPSTRRDVFLVGRNESGTAFAHAIPATVTTVPQAIDWIWEGNDIIERHGDVAIAKPKINIKQHGNFVVTPVADNHWIEGEVLWNGAIYVRNARLYHSKGQHPDVKIGSEWMKIVVGRRSTRRAGRSSRD